MKNLVHCVSAFNTIDYGGTAFRLGDLNGDGAPDLLFIQTFTPVLDGSDGIVFRSREISCLTATTIHGEVLWQQGVPSRENRGHSGDLPVQVYDWDGDGENEVIYIRQARYAELYADDPKSYRGRAKRYEGTATLVVLDGRTGREKASLAVPAPADDSLVFADLTGRGRREDFVLKDPYGENVYGISRTGEFLWHWHGGPWPVAAHNMQQSPLVFVDDPACEAGHYPAVADVDGDGRDEVFFGFALLDHDGRVMYRRDTGGGGHHADANYIARLPDGTWRLLYGNHGVHCLAVDGTERWQHPLVFHEAQHVVAGRFRDDSALQVAVIDRGTPRTPEGQPACLYLFDVETGREFWRRPQLPGGWGAACMDIHWCGKNGRSEILVYKRGTGAPIAIYDGQGDIVDEIDAPPDGPSTCSRADLWGDSRDEVIVAGNDGVRIEANRRALPVLALYNHTVYHGGVQAWLEPY